jgi:hypothetical protein
MNDTYIDTHNPIFQIIHELYDRQQNIHHKKRYKSGNRYIKQISTRNTHLTKESYAQKEHISTKQHAYRHTKEQIVQNYNKLCINKHILYITERGCQNMNVV